MKVNLEEVKNNVQNALSKTSGIFDFAEINFHLKSVLNKIEEKQLKEQRKNRNETVSNNMIMKNGQLMTPNQAKNLISKIDKLIELEQKKIENPKGKETEQKTLLD